MCPTTISTATRIIQPYGFTSPQRGYFTTGRVYSPISSRLTYGSLSHLSFGSYMDRGISPLTVCSMLSRLLDFVVNYLALFVLNILCQNCVLLLFIKALFTPHPSLPCLCHDRLQNLKNCLFICQLFTGNYL